MFAFEEKPGNSPLQVVVFCTLASVVDALVTIGIYALLVRMGLASRTAFYLLAAALGAACAVIFERFAFAFGLWGYGESMPVVPLVRVGLLPLAQLTILVPAAIRLTGKLSGESGGQGG